MDLPERTRPMKAYITADIEGVTGTTHWDQTEADKNGYQEAREQMTAEVAAACQGLLEAGVKEIWIKDAHGEGRNLIPARLPREIQLIRGWSGHPFVMVQELDETFAGLVMIGYHSRAGADTNPLSHTQSLLVDHIKINGDFVSEFLLHGWVAALYRVPVAFVSGDEGLCAEVKAVNENVATCPVMRGIGDSTLSLHPEAAVERIREGVRQAFSRDLAPCRLRLPEAFEVEIRFKSHARAYRSSFYPGVRRLDALHVAFSAKDYFEVLRIMLFTL